MMCLFVCFLLGILACQSENKTQTDSQTGPQYATEFTAVVLDAGETPTFQIAIQACVGLHNRRIGGSYYLLKEAHDWDWLNELGILAARTIDSSEFLNACLNEFSGCLKYNYAEQQSILPSLLSVAAVREAIPTFLH